MTRVWRLLVPGALRASRLVKCNNNARTTCSYGGTAEPCSLDYAVVECSTENPFGFLSVHAMVLSVRVFCTACIL